MSGPALDHERVERRLAAADLEVSGAEVHGMLCGLLCVGKPEARDIWFGELYQGDEGDDLLLRECRQTLDRLHDETLEAITGPGLGFTPLLPDDDKPLNLRAAAVREWSQGFLYGIGMAGIAPERELSEHTREALRDFGEITRMDLESLDEAGEEAEDDLMQISEFLWVAAMMVHDDLVSDPTERT